eukprot:m.138783 g.138783  ORF g.138783 m.138783 type:complete len:467 (+) comp38259_c0_seq2:454-1854(+)
MISIPAYLEAVNIKGFWKERIREKEHPNRTLKQLISSGKIKYKQKRASLSKGDSSELEPKQKRKRPSDFAIDPIAPHSLRTISSPSPVDINESSPIMSPPLIISSCQLLASPSLQSQPSKQPLETLCQELTADNVAEMFKKAHNYVEEWQKHLKTFSTERYSDLWGSKLKSFDCKQPEYRFGVHGTTGCGKSTLVNALLDANVLPSSEGGNSCTPVPIWVKHAPGNEHYQVVAKFVSKKKWEKERESLCCILDNAGSNSSENGKKSDDYRAALKKLQAVYGKGLNAECGLSFTARTKDAIPESVACHLKKRKLEFSESTDKKLLSELKKFFKTCGPVIAEVVVTVPLRKGGVGEVCQFNTALVDLPGTEDIDTSLTKAVEKSLETCSHVMMVYDVKRIGSKQVKIDNSNNVHSLGCQFQFYWSLEFTSQKDQHNAEEAAFICNNCCHSFRFDYRLYRNFGGRRKRN